MFLNNPLTIGYKINIHSGGSASSRSRAYSSRFHTCTKPKLSAVNNFLLSDVISIAVTMAPSILD